MGNVTNNNLRKANELNNLAGECLNRNEIHSAIEHFEMALDLLPESEKKTRAKIYNNLGHASVQLDWFEKSLMAFGKAERLFSDIGDVLSQAEQLGNIGSVYRNKEQWDISLYYYYDALEIMKKISHESGIGAQMSNIAFAYSRKGELEKSLEYFQEAKERFNATGESKKAELCQSNIESLRLALREP